MDQNNKRLTTKDVRSLLKQIQSAENQELAVIAYVASMVAPYYSGLLIDNDPDDLTDAEQIERNWFGYGLDLKTLDDIDFAGEFINGVIRRRFN